jgi:uncharacterized protein YbaR (Trm112 family)
MGMFDTVFFICPGCKGDLSTQSKAGDCTLKYISGDMVPVQVAVDIWNDTMYCETCDKTYYARIEDPVPPTTVKMIASSEPPKPPCICTMRGRIINANECDTCGGWLADD